MASADEFNLTRDTGGVSARLIADNGETVLYDACWDEGAQRIIRKNLACSSRHFWERFS